MRSSRSAPDPLDPGRIGFAHRGLHHWPDIPENSGAAFAAALELGAGIECDLRLTADDRLVVYHDADGRRLSSRAGRVIDCTAAELRHWRVVEMKIPTLEELLAGVGGRVPLLLEAKIAGPELWRVGPALLRALKGYRGPVGVMSFDPRLPRWLRTNAPHIRRGLVISADLSSFRRRWALWIANPDFLAIDIAALDRPWVAALRARLPVYSWTVRTADDRAWVERRADASIWEGDGRP